MNWDDIEQTISTAAAAEYKLANKSHVGGGCINDAMKISGTLAGQPHAYFIKFNEANRLDMFEAEAAGLHEMAEAKAIKVPEPVCTGISGSQAYIVMEHLEMGGGARGVMSELGEQLAELHRHTNAQFGWHRENTIGSTPQINDWEDNWVSFWQRHRLGFQIELAARRGYGSSNMKRAEKLNDRIAEFFTTYQPEASLIHGDLWSGNYSILATGEPVIFDPATYYGDREAEIAMTELFGGFAGEFYTAYNNSWPLDEGYQVRKTLYNAYHILNHFNMFGGGYGSQAASMIDRCLADLG